MKSPVGGPQFLAHFHIKNYIELSLFGVDISISNAVVWMWLATLGAFAFFMLAFSRPRLVPGRLQMLAEMGHDFVAAMVRKNVRPQGRRYFPVVFTLFFFILFGNLVGLLPGAFTPTSQIIVTATLAAFIFFLTVIIRVLKHGFGFFRAFAPGGMPKLILPLLVPIELLSYIARPVSLAVRLFANMTAGHTVLAVIAVLGTAVPWLAAIVPMALSVVLLAVEVFIAFIQAFIFTILTCVYIDDALDEG